MNEIDEKNLQILFEHNKIMVRHISNALIRHMIIYLLKKEEMHGYKIMKKINEFFNPQIEKGMMKKIPTSKIYPILNKMEEENLIRSHESESNNMKVKLYTTTQLGEEMYDLINEKINSTMKNDIWKDFIDEIIK